MLAIVAYVPLLATHSGNLGADTKAYLYLDPSKLLSKAPYLWDSSVGLGTVTHQNIGYLFPMGPYYWIMQTIGCPDWIAQRIWMGSIIFLAGLGVRYLLGTLAWEGAGVTVASFAYALSPYILHYIYKHSVILLPFTALPWLVAFCARALRQGGWRYPALFALTALASGGVNATSLLLVLIAPGLWVLHVLFVEREMTIREAIKPILRIGVLTASTSLWWIAGLLMQGSYGINVLRFTETYHTVADSSSSTEIGRSMGYWFLYGVDNFGPWFRVVENYTRSLPTLAISLLVPIVCVCCALWVRFRYRVFFVGITLAGLIVSVGAHPWKSPSPYGQAFKAFTTTASGLAMRSTPRAVPLLALGMAVFLGAGVAAAARLRPNLRLAYAGAALALVAMNMFPMFTGKLIDPSFERPNDVPDYWVQAGKHLDRGDRNTRTLEVPGIDFANYRWGASVDPITPGLTDRDYAARELVPYGSDESADLMNAVDAPFQTNTLDPTSLSPLMRMMGVGDVTLRSDLEYERYRVARPKPMLRSLDLAPGLGKPATFGPDTPNVARSEFPLHDEFELSIPAKDPDPHAVSIYPVDRPIGMIHTVPTAAPIIVSGNGAGLVGVSEAGLLDPKRLIVYSGSVSGDRQALDRLLAQHPELIITDSNTRSGRRWGNTKDNDGFIETADSKPTNDPTDNRLDLFGGRGSDVQTVAEYSGPFTVTASDYGNPLNFTPGDRPSLAIDGDPTTAWKANAFGDVNGQWIELAAKQPVAPRTLHLSQATLGVNRYITKVHISFDTAAAMDVALDDASRNGGQVIDLADRRFRKMRITVTDSNRGVVPTPHGLSGVGFAEIRLGNFGPTTEIIRPPVDLLDAVGNRSATMPLSYVFGRRIAPPETGAPNEQLEIIRRIEVPTARGFMVRGKIRIDPRAATDQIDALLGLGPQKLTSSSSINGDPASRASAAFDGNPDTAWQSRMVPKIPQEPEWLQAEWPAPRTVSFSSLRLSTDHLHSVPTRIHFEVDGVPKPAIDLPTTSDGGRGTTTEVSFPPVTVTGRTVRLVIDRTRVVSVKYVGSPKPVVLPVGVAEVGATDPTLPAGAAGTNGSANPVVATLGAGRFAECRSDLLSIDGSPVPIRLLATSKDAADLQRRDLRPFEQCAPTPTALSAGSHLVAATDGRTTGVDLDQIALSSPAPAATASATTASMASSPSVAVHRVDRAGFSVDPASTRTPYWFVLGQTHNAGWTLTANGRDLGRSVLVNGYANGWLVDPAKVGPRPHLVLRWAPQKTVWWCLALSAVGLAWCIAALFISRSEQPVGQLTPARPEFVAPLDAFGRSPRPLTVALATLGAAAAGGVFVGLWWAPLCALGMWAALTTDAGWRALRFAMIGSLMAAFGFVMVQQWRFRYGLGGDWPQHFSAVSPLGMFAYSLLGIECVVEALRGGWRRDADLDHS